MMCCGLQVGGVLSNIISQLPNRSCVLLGICFIRHDDTCASKRASVNVVAGGEARSQTSGAGGP